MMIIGGLIFPLRNDAHKLRARREASPGAVAGVCLHLRGGRLQGRLPQSVRACGHLDARCRWGRRSKVGGALT